MLNNWLAFLLTSAHALGWLELCNHFARIRLVDQTTARKLIHIGRRSFLDCDIFHICMRKT